MDKLNEEWLNGKLNFYFSYKRQLLESMIEGTCLNVGCGSHIVKNALNINEGLPKLPYADNSFDTVICSDVLEHVGPHKQAVAELLRIAKKKVIITVPAYRWLYGKYDIVLGHKRRYNANDFSGFQVTYLFWFLVPILFLRKLLGLRHRPLPECIDRLFLNLSKLHFNFGTTILAVKYKIPYKIEEKYKVSIFVPVFNEEKIIDRDIKAIDYMINSLPVQYEIFIVNDASKDKTEIIAKKIEQANRKVTLLNYNIGPTRRENLARSFKKASGDIIAFVDIDVLASLRFLPDLIDCIRQGYDIATGSRYAQGARIRRRPFRLLVSVLYNIFIRLLFRTNIYDHMCGFKAFKRDVILKLAEEMGYDESLKRGIFWDTELLVMAVRHGFKIKEIPIWWKERNKSALYFKREVKSLFYSLRFALRLKRADKKFNKNLEKINPGGEIGVLYITYDGLCDPLGQSQIVPYVKALANNIKIVMLSYEKKGFLKRANLFNETGQVLSRSKIKWQALKYHKTPCFLATLYDVANGYIRGLFLIKKHNLNIVHARGYIPAFIALCLKRSLGVRFVFDIRGFWVDEKVDAGFWDKKSIGYKTAKSLEKIMLNSADQIIVLTEKAKSLLMAGISKTKNIEVIPTCVDLRKFNLLEGPKKNFLRDRIVTLYSGSVGTFYGFKDAVDFFRILYSREKRSFFLVLINNQKEIVENLLKIYQLPEESYKVLSLPYSEVCDWLKEADVSLIFYHRNNSSAGCCPTKFGESLACGVPVLINSSIGDTEEMVEKERIGIILNEFSETAYRKAAEELEDFLIRDKTFKQRCRGVAENFFSLEGGVEKYRKVYQGVLKT